MTKLLLERGAAPNTRAAWGWYTPLHLACKAGDEPMIWLLLAHGAKWKLTDKHKKTPLQWAVKAGKASVAYRVDQVSGDILH
jgi:ankyrin repeat protein